MLSPILARTAQSAAKVFNKSYILCCVYIFLSIGFEEAVAISIKKQPIWDVLEQ